MTISNGSSSSAPALDFAALLSREYRAAEITHLTVVPLEEMKVRRETNDSNTANTASNSNETTEQKFLMDEPDESEEEARNLVRQLVACTPTFVHHAEPKEPENEIIRVDLERYRPPTASKHSSSSTDNTTITQSPPESAFHQVELEDWEQHIQWDGVKTEESTTNTTTPVADELLQQRRNPLLEHLILDDSNISWEGTLQDTFEKARKVPLLLELGVAGQSIARHILPPPRPKPCVKSQAYQNRMLQRDWKEQPIQPTGSLHTDREKLEQLIAERQMRREQMAKDKTDRVTAAMGTLAMGGGRGRTITSSLMGPGGTERTGRPSRHVGSSSLHDAEYVEQLDLVNQHTLFRDMSKVMLRQYQRPKLPLDVVRRELSWQFQIRHVRPDTTPNNNLAIMMGTHAGAISKVKLRTEADLTPTEGKLILLEYAEERPPVALTKGMASKIVNYYRGDKARCPVSAGGGDRPTRRKRVEDTPTTTATTAATRKERPGRLRGPTATTTLTDWVGRAPKKTLRGKDDHNKGIHVLPEGITEILHPKVHGPFIGEVEEGTTQSGLITNLFAAPIFRHEPESTDFLMILGKTSYTGLGSRTTGTLGVVLREFPSSVFTVGQTEPRTKVYAPNTAGEKAFTGPFVSYQIAKVLSRTQAREGHGLRFDEIQDRVLPNFGLMPNALRQRLKHVAIYDKNTQIWTTKAIGFEDYPGVDGLAKSLAPEGVAAYEMACTAARHLSDLGVHHLFSGSHAVGSVGVTMVYLAGQVNAVRELSRKLKKLGELSRTNKSTHPIQVAFYERASSELDSLWKTLRRRHEVARFIYEELLLAPWHMTQEFIEVHKKAEGTGMMKLTGLGDPSGTGEGFSFLREVDTKPSKSVGTAGMNAQMKKITGTEDDLRKLTMKQMASLLRSYGMPQSKIDTLKRWDRVHVIRDMSTKAASDGIGDGLERFARGEKMKLSEQKENYRERIQVIWRRQVAALSTDLSSSSAAAAAGTDTRAASSEADGEAGGSQKAQKKKADMEKEDSDSDSDDDDLAATFEEEMMDRPEANQLVAAHARGATGAGEMGGEAGLGKLRAAVQDKNLSKDARELAALKRQREEERAAREGLLSAKAGASDGATLAMSSAVVSNRKVIRRRVTKTFPDGRQTTTFKFIVNPEEVGKIISKLQQKEDDKKDNNITYKQEEKPLGHAMFEDEDDFEYTSRSRGQGKSRGRVVRRRGGPTAKAPPRSKNLQLGKLKTRVSKEQRIKKRKREEEEAELYVATSRRKGTSNRRERGSIRSRAPHVIFADRLEAIRSKVESRPGAGPFHKPVNSRVWPRYYEVISNPIDLQTIRDKIGRYECYRTAESFLKDFELMKANAIKFNGNGSQIAEEAIAIYEAVKDEIEANRTELSTMEVAVSEQLSGKPRAKKKKKASTKSSSPASSRGTVSMVGGLAVNLGDLQQLGDIDSGSDESLAGLMDLT